MLFERFFPRWLHQDFYLDWELEHWSEIYKNQTELLTTDCFSYSQPIPQASVFDNTSKNINLNQIRIQLNPGQFYPDTSFSTEVAFCLYRIYSFLHGRQVFNSDCLKLTSVQLQKTSSLGDILLLKVQEVDYFSYIKKNLLLDVKFSPKSRSLREKIHIDQNNFSLEELHSSRLANILGVNILIFTIDGTLILNKRSSKTLIRPGELCSSASGTLNKSDIIGLTEEYSPEKNLLFPFREAFEELGISDSDFVESQIKFLGITRDLIRGGQPDIFLSAQTKLNQDQVLKSYSSSTDKAESSSLFFFNMDLPMSSPFKSTSSEKKTLQRKVIELLDAYDDIISLPLLTNLVLWCRAYCNNPQNCDSR